MRRHKRDLHPLGEILLETGAVSRAQLDAAVGKQANGETRSLGELLLELGHISTAELDLALLRQRARRGDLRHADSTRMIERATQCAQQAVARIDELTAAAQELAARVKG